MLVSLILTPKKCILMIGGEELFLRTSFACSLRLIGREIEQPVTFWSPLL